MIPNLIWQTHDYPFDNMPDDLKNIVDLLRSKCEGWEHRYVDKYMRKQIIKDNKMLYKIYINIDEAFQSVEVKDNQVFVCGKLRDYKYAKSMYRSDVLRLVLMYEYGGLYMDADTVVSKNSLDLLQETDYDVYANVHAKVCSRCLKPLREINEKQFLPDEAVVSKGSILNIYGIDAIAAKPKLEFFGELINKLVKANTITKFQNFYTEMIREGLNSGQPEINTQLDVIEYNLLEDKSDLPFVSGRNKILRREERIICPCTS